MTTLKSSVELNALEYYPIVARVIVPVLQARCASCRGLHGSASMQGGLRRGAHGTTLLLGMVGARVAHIGEAVHARGACANSATINAH